MNASALSVMPVGLVDTLKPDDISVAAGVPEDGARAGDAAQVMSS